MEVEGGGVRRVAYLLSLHDAVIGAGDPEELEGRPRPCVRALRVARVSGVVVVVVVLAGARLLRRRHRRRDGVGVQQPDLERREMGGGE